MFETLFNYPWGSFARGKLVYLSRIPGELRLIIFAACVALVWYLYRKAAAKVGTRRARLLMGLRMCTYVLVLFMLGMPALQSRERSEKSMFTAVLVDTSRSMSIEDVDAGDRTARRLEAAVRVLRGAGGGYGLLHWLDERTRVLVYSFDAHARRQATDAPLEATGDYTNIFRAIRDVDADLTSLPLAAAVMLTDGCRNTGGTTDDAARLLSGRGVPLYVVGLGDAEVKEDYEVVHVVAPRRVRRNTEVEVQMTLRHSGFTRPFTARIVRDGNEILAEPVEPSKEGDIRHLRATFTPDHLGTATYAVEIPPGEGERIVENNSRTFVVEIKDDRLPVLYIEGSPRMEYRFLRRAMFRDPDFRVVGMLRLKSGQFLVQGGNEDETYLRQGFPGTQEQLYAFQAVVLGDIEARYFTGPQLEMLREFVQQRGGGLLMLGGVNSFGLGRYAGTPVGNMLPVRLSDRDPPYSDAPYNPRLTEEGSRHPVMRLSPNPKFNQHLWEKAPPLMGITPVHGVKPGASLLIVKDDGFTPVLAVQNYGAGRVAAFMSGGSWYWQVSMPASNEFHERFWKQLVRWLVMGARQQLVASTDRDIYGRRDPVMIRATVLSRDLRPVNDASVVATVIDPLGNREEIPMYWILSEEGVYQCRHTPGESGSHAVSVRVDGWDEVKPAATAFLVTDPVVEFSDSNLKEAELQRMAEMTGGAYHTYEEAHRLQAELEEAIERAFVENVRPKTDPLWDMPVLYVLLIGLLGGEWTLRRRCGLA